MTNRQVRYFSRRIKSVRLGRLLEDVHNHPHRQELISLIDSQVRDDTAKQLHQTFYS
jgi:hypothetical protein